MRILFIGLLFLLPTYSFAEVSVVVGAGSPITSADAKEIKRVFLGKAKSLGGTTVTPLNQDGTSATATAFNREALNKSSSQVKAYWSRLVFTGKGIPPKEVASDAEVISRIEGDPTLVGYVDSTAVTGDIKVLIKF